MVRLSIWLGATILLLLLIITTIAFWGWQQPTPNIYLPSYDDQGVFHLTW
jgi:hypothetical protein